MNERKVATHLSHCNQGDYIDSCKYGDHEACPALLNVKPPVILTSEQLADFCDPSDAPLHLYCQSTWTMRAPTAKELTLDVMQLVVKRSKLPLWRFIKRFKLSVEIEQIVLTARLWGYFEVKK